MKSNEGRNDRAIRLVLGMTIASVFIFNNSAWAFLGLIPFVTAIVGICPLYSVLGINTKEKESSSS